MLSIQRELEPEVHEEQRELDAAHRHHRLQVVGADHPLAGTPPMLSTYLLRRQGEPSEPMKQFIERVKDGAAPVDDEPVL